MKWVVTFFSQNPLLTPVCCIRVVFSMISTILPLYLYHLGFSTPQIGLVVSVYGYAALVMDFSSSVFIDRLKKAFIIKIGILFLVICFFCYCWQSSSLFFYCCLQVLLGFSLGLFRPASIALASELAGSQKVGAAIGNYNSAYIVGNSLGPLFVTLMIKEISYKGVFAFAFIITLIAFIYVVRILRLKEADVSTKGVSLKKHFHDMTILAVRKKLYVPMIFILADILMLRMWMTFLPIFIMQEMQTGIEVIGIIFSIESVMYVLTQPLWGKIVDRRGRGVPTMIGLFAPVMIAATSHIGTTVGLIILYACMGLLNSAAYPAYMSLAIDYAGLQERGRTMSLMTSASDVGYILGPICGGMLYSYTNSFPAVFYSAILPALISLGVWMITKNNSVSVEVQKL